MADHAALMAQLAGIFAQPGVAQIHSVTKGYSLTDPLRNPVLGRAVVFHTSAAGAPRVGCGLIQPSRGEVVKMGKYPAYAGTSGVIGTLVLDALSSACARSRERARSICSSLASATASSSATRA